jgi:hypothetical protein
MGGDFVGRVVQPASTVIAKAMAAHKQLRAGEESGLSIVTDSVLDLDQDSAVGNGSTVVQSVQQASACAA